MSDLAVFEENRPRLFGIAYRMLGTVADAEDVVQDAWLRWNSARDVENAPAFLTTVVTRLSITALTSARARRETYIGPWLPEPIDTSADPLLGAERAEALDLAVLLLLERLTPAERAAYVLHEAFAYPFQRISEIVETSEANARKLASRARRHLETERGFVPTAADRERLLAAFLGALESGDLAALESVLAADVASYSDGGGVVSAARNVVSGRSRVAALLAGLVTKYSHGVTTIPVHANGETTMLVIRDGEPLALWSLDLGREGVRRFLIVLNPEKLGGFRGAAAEAP